MEKRPLELIEAEFIAACTANDMDDVIDLLRERSDIVSFFCAASTTRGCSAEFREVLNTLPEDLEFARNIIKRMTSPGRRGFLNVSAAAEPMVVSMENDEVVDEE